MAFGRGYVTAMNRKLNGQAMNKLKIITLFAPNFVWVYMGTLVIIVYWGNKIGVLIRT